MTTSIPLMQSYGVLRISAAGWLLFASAVVSVGSLTVLVLFIL